MFTIVPCNCGGHEGREHYNVARSDGELVTGAFDTRAQAQCVVDGLTKFATERGRDPNTAPYLHWSELSDSPTGEYARAFAAERGIELPVADPLMALLLALALGAGQPEQDTRPTRFSFDEDDDEGFDFPSVFGDI